MKNFELMEEFLEFYPNAIVLDYNKTCVLGKSKSGKAYYWYKINNDMTLCFNLLSEVAEPYQSKFEKMIKDNGLIVSVKETETDYFEVIN